MIVALTGATGFLGSHVLAQVLGAGHQVRALTRQPQAARDGVTWIAGNLDEPGALIALVSGVDVVVHIAGVVNAPDAQAFDRGNRIGTANIISSAQAMGVKRFVHVSSLAARLPELSLYGASKRAAEDIVIASALDWRVVRPPAIYGPGDTDNLELFRFAKRGLLPLPRRGRLSLVHADDLAPLILAMAGSDVGRVLYEADDGQPGGWSHYDYARAIGDAVGRRPLVARLPKAVLNLGAAIDGAVRGSRAKLTRDRVAYMTHEDWTIEADLRPPISLWTPQIPTLDGLKATAAWYRDHGWL